MILAAVGKLDLYDPANKYLRQSDLLQAIGDWRMRDRQQEAPGLVRLSTALQDLLQYFESKWRLLTEFRQTLSSGRADFDCVC